MSANNSGDEKNEYPAEDQGRTDTNEPEANYGSEPAETDHQEGEYQGGNGDPHALMPKVGAKQVSFQGPLPHQTLSPNMKKRCPALLNESWRLPKMNKNTGTALTRTRRPVK